MANIKSAQKRIEINKRNNSRNRVYKSIIKTYTKKYISVIKEYKNNPNAELFKIVQQTANELYSKIDKALKEKVLHKNKAARKKSQIGINLKTLYNNNFFLMQIN
jgi:small subunit ribosomal protein S20